MKTTVFWFAVILHLTAVAMVSGDASLFNDNFTGQTMRVDTYHTGTADEEHFSLDRVRIEGPWPGSRTQLLDDTNLGKYFFEVANKETGEVLYSRGFASIYGEWETTGEAAEGLFRTFPEAVRFPEPREPVTLSISKRGSGQRFERLWSTEIDPGSRFVDRSQMASRRTRAVLRNGDPAVKADLVILGDGYTAEEMMDFQGDVDHAVEELFSLEPFASHKDDFNIWAVESPAAESGVSRPRSSLFRDSPLGATYNSMDSERYVLTNDDRAWRDVAAAVPYDFVLILVNSEKYGGGGIFGLYSTAAADSGYLRYLVIHEFAHHFAGLGDEYFTSPVAYEEVYKEQVEPWEPNVTALLDPERLKWKDLVDSSIPLPTPWQKSDYETYSRASQKKRRELREQGVSEDELETLFKEEQQYLTEFLGSEEFAGRVGAFEGANYEATGMYRPRVDCVMFTRNEVGFCPVCSRAISRVINLYSR